MSDIPVKHSLPDAPRIYRTEEELAVEILRRMQEVESGAQQILDAEETLRCAHAELIRVRTSI